MVFLPKVRVYSIDSESVVTGGYVFRAIVENETGCAANAFICEIISTACTGGGGD